MRNLQTRFLVGCVSLGVAVLALLHWLSLIIPIVEFVLAAGLLASTCITLYAIGKLFWIAKISQIANFSEALRLDGPFLVAMAACAIFCSVLLILIRSQSENQADNPASPSPPANPAVVDGYLGEYAMSRHDDAEHKKVEEPNGETQSATSKDSTAPLTTPAKTKEQWLADLDRAMKRVALAPLNGDSQMIVRAQAQYFRNEIMKGNDPRVPWSALMNGLPESKEILVTYFPEFLPDDSERFDK